MHLNWKWQLELSALHAAWCAATATEQTQHLSEALRASSLQLSRLGPDLHLPADRFWENLMQLAPDQPQYRELAKRFLLRMFGNTAEPQVSRLAAAIADVKLAFVTGYPDFTSEIPLRAPPLQQLWEAHGPGLLTLIGRFVEPELLVESADVYLVQPVLGGAGLAHFNSNRVHIEAVLTNDQPQLPETLRLAWLLSQLDLERPVHSGMINSFHLKMIAGFAMLPPTLLAGSELELCRFSVPTLQLAIQYWRLDTSAARAASLAEVLMTWWETYAASRPAWSVALTGLDHMLTEIP